MRIPLNYFFYFFITLLISTMNCLAQDSSAVKSIHDSTISKTIPDKISADKKKLRLVAVANAAFYTGSLIILNEAWYKGFAKSPFHVFDDSKEWLQVDKAGHGWTAYNISKKSFGLWKWTGLSHEKAALLGGINGFAYLTVIEFLDAHSSDWGWSWSDMAANALGSGLFSAQELLWKDQRIQLKFSFQQVNYAEKMLNDRAAILYGKSWNEQMLKDYNGLTIWLSANLKSFMPQTNIPKWLNLAVGYGADGMFGGFNNIATDDNGNILFNRSDIPRVRQFYVAPDIDFTKIKTNKKWLRTAFYFLNTFKIPAPSLMLDSKGKMKFYGLYF